MTLRDPSDILLIPGNTLGHRTGQPTPSCWPYFVQLPCLAICQHGICLKDHSCLTRDIDPQHQGWAQCSEGRPHPAHKWGGSLQEAGKLGSSLLCWLMTAGTAWHTILGEFSQALHQHSMPQHVKKIFLWWWWWWWWWYYKFTILDRK